MINFEVYKENAEERLSYTSSDTPRTFIRALEDIVKLCEYGQKLEIDNRTLQEQVQMRQELVEQYEQDIAKFRQKVQELERQRDWLAKHIERYCDMTCPWSLGIYDKKHKCPHWTPYEGMPKNDSFKAWKEYLFGGIEFEDDTINCGTPISICLIQTSKKVTEQTTKEAK